LLEQYVIRHSIDARLTRVWPVAALKAAHQSPVAAELVSRKSKKMAHEMLTVSRLGLPAKLRRY
jgi:hypothetical protein